MVNEKFWQKLWEILIEIEDKSYWSSNGYQINSKRFNEIKKRLEKLLTKNK